MKTSPTLPSGLRPPAMLGTAPTAGTTTKAGRIRLGYPGRCPKTPTLNLFVFDDSGSLSGPVGNDSLSNRYEEARRALEAVGRHCSCRECLAAIIHFDTPTAGCVEPTPFTRAGRRQLATGLSVPRGAAGASLFGASLAKAESLAARYPDHGLSLTILTDWELFDNNVLELFSRLAGFPGTVRAVGLRTPPPVDVLDPAIQTVTITRDSPKGSLARTVFNSLTLYRRDRELAT